MGATYQPGDRVLVKTFTGCELVCHVVCDLGLANVLVRHEPSADQLVTHVFPVPRVRVRAAESLTPSDTSR